MTTVKGSNHITSIPPPGGDPRRDIGNSFVPLDARTEQAFTVNWDGGEFRFPPDHDLGESDYEAFSARIAQGSDVRCDVIHFDTWRPSFLRSVLIACYLLAKQFTTTFIGPANPAPQPSFLTVVLARFEDAACHHRLNLIDTVAQTVAVNDGDAIRERCNHIAEVLRRLGIRGYNSVSLQTQAKAFLAECRSYEVTARLVDLWPDGGGRFGSTRLPAGWSSDEDGLLPDGARESDRIPGHLAITQRLTSPSSGKVSLELAWKTHGSWTSRVVPREQLCTKRKCVELASYGVPVTDNNVEDVIDFLEAFEVENRERIPSAIISEQMGWIGNDGQHGFLCGRCLITGATGAENLEPSAQTVEFAGGDGGDEQLADAVTTGGTFEGWREAIASLQGVPPVLLAIYASFAAPLLKVLGAGNFVVSFAGPTSTGKTVSLAAAAATWGRPLNDGAYILNWDTTRVGIERVMQNRSDLPLVIDDTKQHNGKSQEIARIIYDAAWGRGRTRGSTVGLAASHFWRTVMITSGEQPLANFSEDGGTRARIVEYWGSPFGERSLEVGRFASRTRASFQVHHGHAGPRFVAYLLANRAMWPAWRSHHQQLTSWFEACAGDNNAAGRMAQHLATLELAGSLAHQALELPWAYGNVVAALYETLIRETAEADRAAAAMRDLLNYSDTRRGAFAASDYIYSRWEKGDCLGIWSHRSTVAGVERTYRAILVSAVNEFLKRAGHDPGAIRRLWAERGWILTNAGQTELKVRLTASTASVIAIPDQTIEQIVGVVDDATGSCSSPRPARNIGRTTQAAP